MPPIPDDTVEVIFGWAVKVGGVFMAFVGGIITTTAAITLKMKGYDDRIGSLENAQKKCQSEVIGAIAGKLDSLPDDIGDRMEKKFNRVHDRVDALILKEQTHDNASVKRDDLTLKKVTAVRDNQ